MDKNLFVRGTVHQGIVNGGAKFFKCSNLKVIENSKWNPALFMETSQQGGGVSYKPIDQESVADALPGNGIGAEVTIPGAAGDRITLVKTADVTVEETDEDDFVRLKQMDEVKDAMIPAHPEERIHLMIPTHPRIQMCRMSLRRQKQTVLW